MQRLTLVTRPDQLQPLPDRRLARRAPKPQGGQANPRRTPRRDRPSLCQVEREYQRCRIPMPILFFFTKGGESAINFLKGLAIADFIPQPPSQNGKQGDVKNVADVNAAAKAEAA